MERDDRLYEVEYWENGGWEKGHVDLGLQGRLKVDGIYYNPAEGKAYILARLYLEPEALKEQGWINNSSTELEEAYAQFAEGKAGLEEYLNALKPYLPEDFDFGAVELRKHPYGQDALYPVVYEIEENGELGMVVEEGRKTFEWVEENRSPEKEEDCDFSP
jgi:hypothetical protein